MLSKRIIPCLDVRAGRIVKGVRFTSLRDAGDPAQRSTQYEAEGADEIVLLDVAATPEERNGSITTIGAVRAAISIPLTVGGGVRTVEDARRLLGAGADRVAVNTAAVRAPNLLADLADQFGSQCIVVSVDAKRHGSAPPAWRVVVRSGQETTPREALAWCAQAESLGAGEVLLTSWDHDGTGQGYDLELIRQITSAISIPVIASGGVGDVNDFASAFDAGAAAALAASVFHDNIHTVSSVKGALTQKGILVRR